MPVHRGLIAMTINRNRHNAKRNHRELHNSCLTAAVILSARGPKRILQLGGGTRRICGCPSTQKYCALRLPRVITLSAQFQMVSMRIIPLLIGLAAFSGACVEARSFPSWNDQPAPSKSIKVFQSGKHVSAPELLPIDVSSAIDTNCTGKMSGDILLAAIVDPTGIANDILIVRPAGANLDRMALVIASQDRFKPGRKDGQAVAVSITINMHLEGCIVSIASASGQTSKLRLLSQPVQSLGPASNQESNTLIVNPPETAETGDLSAPFKMGGSIKPPMPIRTPEAEFSEEARQKGIQGTCIFSLIVDAQGIPRDPQILRSIGYGLDARALEAVKAYRFKPAMKDGHPVPVRMSIEVRFRLGP